jgi:RNase P subunit RPR2
MDVQDLSGTSLDATPGTKERAEPCAKCHSELTRVTRKTKFGTGREMVDAVCDQCGHNWRFPIEIAVPGPCPRSPNHQQRRYYKITGGGIACVCDDCGTTWPPRVGHDERPALRKS